MNAPPGFFRAGQKQLMPALSTTRYITSISFKEHR